mmetsp:Transcript_14115/g.29681  ORF Transcript_14115/g.29681 Transcript_14115/m.29681 type:complete len:308 (+) Transcript_14115:309-1232(+)
MLRQPIVHLPIRPQITKKRRIPLLRHHVHPHVPKVGRPPLLGRLAIHDHGGDPSGLLKRESIALPVAMGLVPIRLRIVESPSKVLNGHEILLPRRSNAVSRRVVDVLVQSSGYRRDEIALVFLLPRNPHPRLEGLSRFLQMTPPGAVRDRGSVQGGPGGRFDGRAFVGSDEVFDVVDFGVVAIEEDSDAAVAPGARARGGGGGQVEVGAGAVFPGFGEVEAEESLVLDLAVEGFDSGGEGGVGAGGEVFDGLEGVGGGVGVGVGGRGGLEFSLDLLVALGEDGGGGFLGVGIAVFYFDFHVFEDVNY